MREFSKYCQQLLVINECVILPGFGALIARNMPSFYSRENEEFIPPYREITFNRNIRKDDGLLGHFLSTKRTISFSEARGIVARWVKELTLDLDAGKKVEFGEIGVFRKGKDSTVVFEPASDRIISSLYYGFPLVRVTERAGAEAMERVRAMAAVYRPRVAAIAAGICLFVTFSLMPLQISRQSKIQQQKAIIGINDIRNTGKANAADSVEVIINEMTLKENALAPETEKLVIANEHKVEEEKKLNEEPLAHSEPVVVNNVEPKISDKHGFYLIAGSFVEMWRAEKYMEELKGKGFSPVIVNTDDKLRIAVGFSGNRQSADAVLAEHRAKFPDMSVWILKK
jgi:cell division septation protein DedD